MKQLLKSPRKLFIPLAIIGLLAILVLSLSNKSQAPDVTFTTIEGKTIKMADLKDKIVLVNFWATDCPGCIAEMPALIETYKQYQAKGFEVIAVAMPYDPPSHVLNYTKKNALPFPVMHDGLSEISTRFDDVRLTPTSFIINKQGKIIRKVIGELDFSSLRALLDAQLAGKI
ncbi:MAG TPA: TlpA disulfide reductase family protein [Methylophilaceae bacterium]|nr:TlpA disulfide reductase family protein [Methylophilaceae bacterium]